MRAGLENLVQKAGTALAPGPLFLVSMGRAGSSLLYALLNKHPQVALMFEADLVCLRPVFLMPRTLCNWAARWELRNEALRRHGLTPGDVSDFPADFRSVFTTTHQLFAHSKGAAIWGDKSPSYFDRLNRMADDFPAARFIIVWRGPKDTANAVLRAASTGSAHFMRPGAVLREFLGYETLKKECDRLLARGNPVCQVNYEDLISETPRVMRQVCDFLQIPYDDSLSILEGADRSAIYEAPHHAYIQGSEIVRTPRPEYVSSELRTNIARYVAWWHQLYGADWPPYPQSNEDTVRPPRRISRVIDAGLYRTFRAWDQITRLAFAFAPIGLLRRYRERQTRRGVGQPEAARSAVADVMASKAAQR
jgi:Sulfotransferase family